MDVERQSYAEKSGRYLTVYDLMARLVRHGMRRRRLLALYGEEWLDDVLAQGRVEFAGLIPQIPLQL